MNVIPNVLKSPNDSCEYYTYQIPSNKLNVFIVNDEHTIMSCVGMMVKIGYMYDTIPGIAHFLEHMLFNGTEKYPNENEFMAFIEKFGGSTNAFTTHSSTFYHYTILNEQLVQSIDMFGQFFVSPLLKKDSIEREINAVNSEHIKNINSDEWRISDIIKKCCNEKHPLKKFGTGSNKTLNINNIGQYVRDFYEQYYSSDIMTLFIITDEKITTVVDIVNNIFENVPLRDTDIDIFENGNDILLKSKLIKVVSIEDTNSVIFNWEIPSYHTIYARSPNYLMLYILGHEGKHTIHHNLSTRGYITDLVCGLREYVDDKCIVSITIRLTPDGYQHIDEIIKCVFEYIDMLKNNVDNLEDIYNELTLTSEHIFKYNMSMNVDVLDKLMIYHNISTKYTFNIAYLLALTHVHDKYIPHVKSNMENILDNCMTRDNVVLIIVSNESDGEMLEDENYGTKYNVTDINIETDYHGMEEFHFEIPSKNKYVSTADVIYSDEYRLPKILNDTTVYFPMSRYNVPTVIINALVYLPLSVTNKKINTETILYFGSILSEINDNKYLCEMAGYGISLEYLAGILYIQIDGNRGKIIDVCKFIIDSILSRTISDNNFEKTKYILKNNDENEKYDSPYQKIFKYFVKTICNTHYNKHDRLNITDGITKDDIIDAFDIIMKNTSVKIMVSGNVNEEIALEAENIFSVFDNKFADYDKYYDIHMHPEGDELMIIPSENEHEQNNAVGYYIYIDNKNNKLTWYKNVCLCNILDNIINSVYFDTLRTKEQFGYIVMSGGMNIVQYSYSVMCYKFLVQSPDKSMNEIIERTDKFIVEFQHRINNMSDDEFAELVTICISSLNIDGMHSNLYSMINSMMLELKKNNLLFDTKYKLYEMYITLNKQDLVDFYDIKFITDKKSIIICI